MHAINFYLFDEGNIDQWTVAMDDVLGRKFVDSEQSQLIKALRDEILAHLIASWSGPLSPPWQRCIDGLQSALSQSRIPLERVATEARTLVECIVESLLLELGVTPKGTLDNKIKALKGKDTTAPWIISHFDCLRVFGNSAVHISSQVSYQPPTLREEDLIAILASLQRVLAFAEARK